jgi:hypothetical protein
VLQWARRQPAPAHAPVRRRHLPPSPTRQGNALNVARTAPFKALNFFSFDMYSRLLAQHLGPDVGSLRFLAGAAAGARGGVGGGSCCGSSCAGGVGTAGRRADPSRAPPPSLPASPRPGITATLVCFPLDTLRTRMMAPGAHHRYGGPLATLRGIARHEGPGALYAGCVPAVIGMAPAGAVFYGVYDILKSRHLRGMAEAEGAAWAAASAAAAPEAGAGKRRRGEAERDAAAAAAEQQRRGQAGAGAKPGLELPAPYMLLYGAIAGVASEVCVYPLEVLRRRMQLQCAPGAAAAAGGPGAAGAAAAAMLRGAPGGAAGAAGMSASVAAWHAHSSAAWGRIALAAASIWREGGAAGFYAGLRPSLLQVLPSAALSYWVSPARRARCWAAAGSGRRWARAPWVGCAPALSSLSTPARSPNRLPVPFSPLRRSMSQ